jgi:uncharacterized glyoxalase superfamily protein PhnB
MKKITPFLWFDGNAEEAMNHYVSIFKNSKILSVTRYGEEGPGPKGTVMTASFQLNGQEFTALNGGPQFTFSPAISFVVNCETQQEVDDARTRPCAQAPFRGAQRGADLSGQAAIRGERGNAAFPLQEATDSRQGVDSGRGDG